MYFRATILNTCFVVWLVFFAFLNWKTVVYIFRQNDLQEENATFFGQTSKQQGQTFGAQMEAVSS